MLNFKSVLFLSLGLTLTLTLGMMVEEVRPSKILVLAFVSTKSHKITYMPLIEALASRGHQITILTPIKETKKRENITEIFTYDVMNSFHNEKTNAFDMKESEQFANLLIFVGMVADACRVTYELPQVKEILNQDFDLIFMNPMMNDCTLGIVHRLKSPLVLWSPISVPDLLANRIGNHFPSSFVSNILLGYPDDMSFYQRFINVGVNLLTEAVWGLYYERTMTSIYRDVLGSDIPPAKEILGNASLILSNGHFSLSRPKPYLPNVIDVGGLHSREPRPLPKDLEDFISKGNNKGFIFFSMGTAIKETQMPDVKRRMILNVFSQLKEYQIIWKWDTEADGGAMGDVPKNVKLSKWLPQQDLLGHPKIRLFITHCGGGGTEEAIYHGVPLLGIPMMGDQDMNAEQAKKHGFLLQLQWNHLTEQNFMDGIQEVLNNPKYRENVKRLSSVFKDQPQHPLERGVFWMEYVLRHKGAPQLRSAAKDLNFIQYHSIDVIAAYLIIIYVTIKFIIFIMKCIYKLALHCCSSKTKNKNKKNKKGNLLPAKKNQ